MTDTKVQPAEPKLATHKCRYCGGEVVKATDKCVACGAGQVLWFRED